MQWDTRRRAKAQRLSDAADYVDGKVVDPARLSDLLQTVIHPGDRVALEGDNQKQADFLSRTLAASDPSRLHDLHMLISSVSRPEHLDLFERGIATKLDLAYAGPQSVRIAQLVEDGTVHIGAIHTYVELYARMFTDLAPDVGAAVCDGGRRGGQPLHRAQHRGHPDDRRGGGLPRRTGDRAGRPHRRPCGPAEGRHPGRLGGSRGAGGPPIRPRAAVHQGSTPDRSGRDPQGHDRDPRRLRAPRSHLAKPWHRIRHGGNRTAFFPPMANSSG